jgi:Protein of unknown function (DUF1553)/Protein of unknown function (DUF1549)/Concanavalin A-like lectin/glucanases superfamily/Planctomycete cytochrome C
LRRHYTKAVSAKRIRMRVKDTNGDLLARAMMFAAMRRRSRWIMTVVDGADASRVMTWREFVVRRLKLSALLALIGLAIVGARDPESARAQNSSPRRIDFNRDIRPILSDKCWACHGPDAANKKIRLRLDSEAAALADLGGGRRAIAPRHPERSELVKRVSAADADMRMPPVSSGRSLGQDEIALLTEWIAQGAPWQTHWAFIPPQRPTAPGVKDRRWPRNAIDYFVLAPLEKEGLAPAPEADRETLVRRVSLDLTGLPPTPSEVDAFLRDRSPRAYENVVDRLLASPRYGERMAFKWLEAARYADTNGYQIDGERDAWRWRDWVIEAFNQNKPFDQFIIEQLAGDLLPNASLDQRIATAFNRNHRTNSEDGIVPEEYAVEYVIDRVDTASTLFLGLTMGCARCHDHKFDPLTQREYYQLYAYFNSIPEDGRASNHGNSAPWVAAPTSEQRRQLAKQEDEIARVERRLAAQLKGEALPRRRWERSLAGRPGAQWAPSDNLVFSNTLDQTGKVEAYEVDADGSSRAESKPMELGFKGGAPQLVASPTGQGAAFNGELYYDAGRIANFNYRDRVRDFKEKFAISAWFYSESEQGGAIVTKTADNAAEQENNLPKSRGYGLYLVNGKLHFNLVSVWADDSFRVETEAAPALRRWHHVVALFDGGEPHEKAQIYLDGEKQPLKLNHPRLFRNFADGAARLKIGAGGGERWLFKGRIDDVRIYNALLDERQIATLACADSLDRIAAIPPSRRTTAQELKLQWAFLEQGAPAALQQTWRERAELLRQRTRLKASFPTVMVMQELPQPRPAFVLKRGAYDAPGEQVSRAVPAVLPPLPAGAPNNRLGLARWLTRPEHPLTSRVTVNRFWQMLFGVGLVKTVEDFGAQGESPWVPELLDWLAVEFQRSGWDTKALLKTIVTSATYRQSSTVAPEILQRDPDNRLLARGPRTRLAAEVIRDQALFIAGLLVEKLGGESTRPYQPVGLWNDMVFKEIRYAQDHGENLYRRSLYTYWKRTIAPPEMVTFDAATRESCAVRETRTNTPLQALNLMNDVVYVETARILAERMMREGGASADERLRFAFRLATARPPNAAELQALRENWQAQFEYFAKRPAEAEKLLKVGEKPADARLNQTELAAYAMAASLILNLDEVITQH